MAKNSIDSLIADIDITALTGPGADDRRMINLWVPLEYKQKFDQIQLKTNRKFGKVLKEIVKRTIDKVSSDNEPRSA